MSEILNLPRLSQETPRVEPSSGGWAELALSVARIGALPIRTDADLHEAILALRLANAQTKVLNRLAEKKASKDQVAAETAHVDQLLDELRARARAEG